MNHGLRQNECKEPGPLSPANSSGLTFRDLCDTLCHMKTISIRELHEKTGNWIREAARLGEIHVSDRGRPVARILPEIDQPVKPYFAQRKLRPGFRRLIASGRLRGGTDSTRIVSEDRDRPSR